MRSRIFTAFESRDFRLMWAGACTSSIGTWMQKLAQSWLVFQLSGSAFMLGLDNFLGEIPIFLFALYAGVVADRVDRRRLLVGSQLIQMLCAFTLAVLFALGRAEVWHILSLSFLVGTAQAFGAPAYQSLLPSLVPREHIPNAIAMNSIQFNVARLVGPAVGGLTLSTLGAAWCFGLNGLSYGAVIATLVLISARHVPSTKKETVMESMKEGLRFIRAQKGMVELILVSFFCTFLGIPIVVFLPVFAKDVFGGAEGTYTLLLTVEAAGAIAGALLVAARGKRGHLGRDAMMSLAGLGVFMTAFALTPRIELALVFLFFGGLTLIACFALLSSLVQMIATDEMRGRVMSIYNIAFRGGMPIGSLVVGQFVAQYSAPPVVAVNGVLLLLIAMFLLLVRREVAEL
ncbi:MAG: MFS transporter [Bryobacteraceae bacterium]|nr:MFS transporter [Solibacteraceae bacterium]MCL4841507.1 MFS transporter [Bryobacteraceae bacterium]MCO5351420.1 MFS transporter [Bryobacteraceae bacterium]